MTQDNRAEELAGFAAGLTFDQLPEGVVHQAKRSVLDTLGCGVFGSTLPWTRTLVEVLQRGSEGGGVAVWGTEHWLSPGDAALVNGTAVHGFELDDLHKEGRIHLGAVLLPAELALACVADRPVSGRDLVTAHVAGVEVGSRIGLAAGSATNRRGFHITGVIGALAGAVSAGRILGLERPEMHDSLGVVASMASGLGAAQYGSTVKRMHAGRASQAAVLAALLAGDGFRGIRDLFEVPHGGYAGTFNDGVDLDLLVRGLGERWETEVLGYKPHAACAASHTSIDAALRLREEGLRAEEIEKVTIRASTHSVDHVGWRYVPDTITTAQMNLSFALASAFLDGRVGVDQFREDRLADPVLLGLAGRVDAVPDPAIDARGLPFSHAIEMTVTTRDGRTLTGSADHGRGSEHHPLSDEELLEKFRDQAGRVLPGSAVDELSSLVQRLEDVDDVRALVALTRPAAELVP